MVAQWVWLGQWLRAGWASGWACGWENRPIGGRWWVAQWVVVALWVVGGPVGGGWASGWWVGRAGLQ